MNSDTTDKNTKPFFKYVFCVVTYRNVSDLMDLLDSIRSEVKGSYKVIIVNNFYDAETENKIELIAKDYSCVFIHSENNGYGAGNNTAISYALNNFDYQFIIVSNPDIVIKKWDADFLADDTGCTEGIVAPKIVTAAGKLQNPHTVSYSKFARKLIYKGFKTKRKTLLYMGIGIGSVKRKFFLGMPKAKTKSIYAAHGAFLLFSKTALEKLNSSSMIPIYDEKMFLFAEEDVLAYKAQRAGIKTLYTEELHVYHKEDGSMKFRNDINEILRNSCIYAYEHYR